jgi:hypothetical protein
LQTLAEDLCEELRTNLRQKFNNKRSFLEALEVKNTNRISEEEFSVFVV